MGELSSDFYNNIITTNIQVMDCLINSLTWQGKQGECSCNDTAITALTALINHDTAITALTALINHDTDSDESHKQILTQLLVQKILSPQFKKELGMLLSSQQVRNHKTLVLLCKVCEGSREMSVVVGDHVEYMSNLGGTFHEVATQSGSTDLEGLEEWILYVTVLWCILRYHRQDISQQ
jgi:hypothetical protein